MMINIKGVEGQEVNVAPKPKFISEELREASWEGRQWLRLEREKKEKEKAKLEVGLQFRFNLH